MTMENVLVILKIALFVVLGGLTIYYRSKTTLVSKTTDLIAQAENTYLDATKAGGIKFEWVVDQLYSFIPAWLKPFVTRAMVENMVQTVFDGVQSYAKMQLDKVTDKAVQ